MVFSMSALTALMGGVLIGAAAVLLMATHGRVMGVSGIVSRLLPPVATDWHWHAAFVAGVIAVPLLLVFSGRAPSITITPNIVLLVLAGLLVGFGTVMGNGCTSGHGVCGLPRFSKRSLVSVAVFMVVAIATVYLTHHVFGIGAGAAAGAGA